MNLFRAQDANILFNKKDKITFYSRDCIQFWLVSVSNWQSAPVFSVIMYYLLNLFWASEQKTIAGR